MRPTRVKGTDSGARRLLAAAALAAAVGTGSHAGAAGQDELFAPIAGALLHPRCLNCHQPDTPLQGSGWRHFPPVRRGDACQRCHVVDGRKRSVPAAAHWQLAPAEMAWRGLSPAALCEALRSPARNGGRDGAALVEHMASDPLVLSGWTGGPLRQAPPVAHGVFVALVARWVEHGQPCPSR